MKILIFVDKWGTGGIETFLLSNLKKMDGTKIQAKIITSRVYSKIHNETLKDLNIEVVELLKKGYNSLFIRNIKMIRSFRNYIVNEKADLISF